MVEGTTCRDSVRGAKGQVIWIRDLPASPPITGCWIQSALFLNLNVRTLGSIWQVLLRRSLGRNQHNFRDEASGEDKSVHPLWNFPNGDYGGELHGSGINCRD